MVKLTLVGRLRDGLPLSQTPSYLNEGNGVLECYRQKGEFVLKEISRGAVTNPKMSIVIDHHSFHYLIGDGICCITFCESWYPRKLAFHFLQDLQKELDKVDSKFIESYSEPYAFKRFDYVIGNIQKQYLDTRTQANLYKLNSNCQNVLDIMTEEFTSIMRNWPTSESEVGRSATITQANSTIWGSHLLEVIALRWTPISIIVMVAGIVLWTTIVLNEFDTLTAGDTLSILFD